MSLHGASPHREMSGRGTAAAFRESMADWLRQQEQASTSGRTRPLVATFTFPFACKRPRPVRLLPRNTEQRMSPPVEQMIGQHRPWDMVDNMALVIIDQTYTAALGIPGRREMRDGSVEVRSAVDADDPDSPVLTINASATRCCVAFGTPRGDSVPYRRFTSPKMKTRPDHLLARSVVSVSAGTLFLARTDGLGREEYWSCAAVAPDVTTGGPLAILDTIVLRLQMAIHLEETILVNARGLNGAGLDLDAIVQTRNALEEMRREMDLQAMMRRRLQKRRHVVGDAVAADHEADEADESSEKMLKKFTTMRCR